MEQLSVLTVYTTVYIIIVYEIGEFSAAVTKCKVVVTQRWKAGTRTCWFSQTLAVILVRMIEASRGTRHPRNKEKRFGRLLRI